MEAVALDNFLFTTMGKKEDKETHENMLNQLGLPDKKQTKKGQAALTN